MMDEVDDDYEDMEVLLILLVKRGDLELEYLEIDFGWLIINYWFEKFVVFDE